LDAHQPANNRAGIVPAAFHPGDQSPAASASAGPAVLTPQVKQMVADEVKAAIADHQKSANSSSESSRAGAEDEIPAALDPNHRVFVVFSVVEAATEDGDTCSLTSSDVVKRIKDAPDSDDTIAVQILASKKSDCAIGTQDRIQLADLNDMQNHLHEQVDAGMKILSEKQGKDGLPPAPVANPRAVSEGIAVADPTAAADLQTQAQEADQAERDVQKEESPDYGANN
jgi:hypothetical protein